MRENDNRIGQMFLLEHLRLQLRDVICINVKYSAKRLKETLEIKTVSRQLIKPFLPVECVTAKFAIRVIVIKCNTLIL